MHMTPQEYQNYLRQRAPRSPIGKNTALAFAVGGLICVLGQALSSGFRTLGLDKTDAGTATSAALVLLSAVLTGLNLYNSIARFAGAGTLVPITGFANSISAPAVEFKTEGFILGVGAKMFTIAGPVIVYGLSASIVYGLVYWIMQML